MGGDVVIFIISVLIIAVLIFISILLTGKRVYHFDKEDYQAKFLAIENKLMKENVSSYSMAVIEADKLLDKALHEMGAPGKTMGDRLKRSGSKFTDINSVWRAHKLRNAIAHESGLEIGFKQANTALSIYKQALKDLGAI